MGEWLDTLAEINFDYARFDQAFRMVIKTSTFRPDIAEIRKVLGLNHGLVDPSEKEALTELKFLLGAMKLHGPKLDKKAGGGVIMENGRPKLFPDGCRRHPEVNPPVLSNRTEMALQAFGSDGTRESGLELLAAHPCLNKDEEDASWRLKRITDMEARWVSAWSSR